MPRPRRFIDAPRGQPIDMRRHSEQDIDDLVGEFMSPAAATAVWTRLMALAAARPNDIGKVRAALRVLHDAPELPVSLILEID